MSMAATTEGAQAQHLQALARANRVRLARASGKRDICDGKLLVAELVMSPPWWAATMTVAECLRAQQRWGHTRARKFLFRLAIGEARKLGSLTERQRLLVAEALTGGGFPDEVRGS